MDAAKETVINLLENNRQTKVKLILKCIMERTEIKTGEVLLPPPTYRGALSEYAALAMPRLAHISGRAA